MNSKVLLDLVSTEQIGPVVSAFERAIASSFATDLSRRTGAEVKRRFEICEQILKALRGDLGWSVPRALDHLPRLLRSELDGVSWEPEARTMWSPNQ